jgi:hypothetical protein
MSGEQYFYITFALTAFVIASGATLAWKRTTWASSVFIGALFAKFVYADYLIYSMYGWTGTAFQAVFQGMMSLTGRM